MKMYCKHLLLVFTVLTVANTLFAQEKHYTLHQESGIENLIEKYRTYQEKQEVTDGYRIQITYTTDREEVFKSKAKLYREFENVPSYIEYDQPNYKLRLGDFPTRLEAMAALQEVIKLYSGAFIVKDRIRIR